jgi:hypothetical protein
MNNLAQSESVTNIDCNEVLNTELKKNSTIKPLHNDFYNKFNQEIFDDEDLN